MTKKNGEEILDPSTIEKCLRRKTVKRTPANFVVKRVVIITWTVSANEGGQSQVSSEVIARNFDNPRAALTTSIRKGWHIIFDLNLGFQTTNSQSAQFVSVNSIWDQVRHLQDPEIQNDVDLLLHRIHERINRLIAAAIEHGNVLGVDYVRAARWLAGLMNVRCDSLRLTGERAAPFVMFIADLVPAFEPTTSWRFEDLQD